MPIEQCLKGLSPAECVQGLSAEELLRLAEKIKVSNGPAQPK